MIINHLLTGMILHVDVLLLTIIWRFLNQKDPFFLEKVYNLQFQETILLMVFDFQGSVKKTLPVHSGQSQITPLYIYILYTKLNIFMPDGKLMEIWEHLLENQGEKTWMNLGSNPVSSKETTWKTTKKNIQRSTPHIGAKMMLKSMFIKGCKLLRKKTS